MLRPSPVLAEARSQRGIGFWGYSFCKPRITQPPCTPNPKQFLQYLGLHPQACLLKRCWSQRRADRGNWPLGGSCSSFFLGEEQLGEQAGQAQPLCCTLTGWRSHHTLQLPTHGGHSIHHGGRELLASARLQCCSSGPRAVR